MRAASTDARVIKAGLVGCGIALSRTPAMHMVEGRALGLAYDYTLFDFEDRRDADALRQAIEAAEADGYAGLNVTYPFKIEALDHLDDLSVNARAVGAVNTIVFSEGRRTGHNTDLYGFAESFRRGLPGVALDHVLLIGAGGAGVAISRALLQLGVVSLTIHDTDNARATALAASLESQFEGREIRTVDAILPLAPDLDGIVNATPVGMATMPGSPFPLDLLRPDLWVADIIYFPLETELLAAARSAGCTVLPGWGMAVYQAVRAFALFTGLTPDPQRMRATFESMGP